MCHFGFKFVTLNVKTFRINNAGTIYISDFSETKVVWVYDDVKINFSKNTFWDSKSEIKVISKECFW